MIGLITALARDAELRQVFRERFIDPHKESLRQVFERAVIRGEVAEDRNLDLLVSLLPALAIHHLLTSGEIPEAQFDRAGGERRHPAPGHRPLRVSDI